MTPAPAGQPGAPARRRRLGVLLATGPLEDDFPTVQSLLQAALADDEDASLFLMDDGVRYACDGRLAPLLLGGVDIALCASDAEAHAIDTDAAAAAGILIGSQHDHARLLRDCDRFLSFT